MEELSLVTWLSIYVVPSVYNGAELLPIRILAIMRIANICQLLTFNKQAGFSFSFSSKNDKGDFGLLKAALNSIESSDCETLQIEPSAVWFMKLLLAVYESDAKWGRAYSNEPTAHKMELRAMARGMWEREQK